MDIFVAEFMLLKINYTKGSSTWPSIQGGVAVYFCVSFSPVMIFQQFVHFLSVRMLAMSLPLFPRVVQEADTIPPHMAPSLTAAIPSTALLALPMCCCLSAFSYLSCLCFYVAFCFSLPHTAVSLCASSILLPQLSDMLETLFAFGK